MSHIEIEKAAYYLHLKYPSNSSETNWYLAKRELELNLDRNKYIIDFMTPNFYTTTHLNIQHYSKERLEAFKEKLYRWGMDEFYEILKRLVIEFENENENEKNMS